MLLDGKTVIVTGGASGIGRGIALAAARHGAGAVIIGDIRETPREGGEATVAQLAAAGVAAVFCKTDVSQKACADRLVAVAEQFGGVDVMVCNAGVATPGDGPQINESDFDKLISINLRGVLLTAQAAAAQMKVRGRGGSIVLISSMGGLRGSAATIGYSATKGGVNLMAASLADAHGPERIRVNTICPGLIDTDLVKSSPAVAAQVEGMCQRMPLRRLGQPSEVGDVAAWLGSDLSSFVTGAWVPVDGGQTAVI